jgi:hypothetical protein
MKASRKPVRRKAALAESRQLPQVRPDVLLEFVRLLVKNTHGGDILKLVLAWTQDHTGATDEEMAVLIAAIKQERRHSQWPPGFMPEDDF